MALVFLSYAAGILTILSPCIFPVLPFVFAKSDRSFFRSGLPLLLGMAMTFSVFTSLALLGGEWLAKTNEVGRWVALGVMATFGVSLIFPHLTDQVMAPFSKLGSELSCRTGNENATSSFVIGISTGLLWAPCAGPILGLVLTGAASRENPTESTALLVAYSFGAITSLALALFAGHRILQVMRKFLSIDATFRRGLGIAVLVSVLGIAFNLDRLLSSQVFAAGIKTDAIENKLLSKYKPRESKQAIDFSGATAWINSQPLSAADLKGKVVLIDFWTYDCINCRNTLPYVKEWYAKYKDKGLVLVGVHTPEYGFERILGNVQKAVVDYGIKYPVALDNSYKIWTSFDNQYWPALYFFDRSGKLRSSHFGEGNYKESEALIQQLLRET